MLSTTKFDYVSSSRRWLTRKWSSGIARLTIKLLICLLNLWINRNFNGFAALCWVKYRGYLVDSADALVLACFSFRFWKMFWRRNYFEETSSLLSPFSPYNYLWILGSFTLLKTGEPNKYKFFMQPLLFLEEISCGNSYKKVFNFCLWEGLLWGQLQFTKSIFLSQQRSDVESIEGLVQNWKYDGHVDQPFCRKESAFCCMGNRAPCIGECPRERCLCFSAQFKCTYFTERDRQLEWDNCLIRVHVFQDIMIRPVCHVSFCGIARGQVQPNFLFISPS